MEENSDIIAGNEENLEVAIKEAEISERKKSKKKNKKSVPKEMIPKETINMIRTTYRNNIDLTSIADNKANILLSLNSLMLTLLIPSVLSNITIITEEHLFLPIFFLFVTSIVSMIIASLATRPVKLGNQKMGIGNATKISPFFFGNYYKMRADEYLPILEESILDPKAIKDFIMLDLYYMGVGLGTKYSRIRTCYNFFMTGILLTVTSTVIVLVFF